MINEILQELENVIPKSLFSKIEADNKQVMLTLNKEFECDSCNEQIIVTYHLANLDHDYNYIDIERNKSTYSGDLEDLDVGIYTLLNCQKIELSFELKIYDVWGNEEDGWEVNDIVSNSIFKKEVLIHVPTMTLILSQKDVRQMLDAKEDIELEWSDFGFTNSNDVFYTWGYFINDSNGKPIGEISLEYSDENIKILDSIQ